MGYDIALQDLSRRLTLEPGDGTLRRHYESLLCRVYDSTCLAALEELRLWQGTAPIVQDAVAAQLVTRLGNAWRWQGIAATDGPLGRLRIPVLRHEATSMLFHAIPGGSYTLGSPYIFEATPTIDVTVRPLLVARYPLLQREWDSVAQVADERKWRAPELPMEGVSWSSLRQWMGQIQGELRLPSEVEWEYACRAGSTTRYYWGDEMDPSHCWHKKNAKGRTHPPEAHNDSANGFGLVDTLGNIYEACQDRYYPDYHGSFPTDGRPRGDDRGTYRVRRGGGWCGEDEKCQSAYRAPYPRWKAVSTLGYRLVRSIP